MGFDASMFILFYFFKEEDKVVDLVLEFDFFFVIVLIHTYIFYYINKFINTYLYIITNPIYYNDMFNLL